MGDDATSEEDLTGQIGAYPTCGRCGSEDVVRDAWAAWNPNTGLWELQQVFDHAVCESCEETTEFVWKKCGETPPEKSKEAIGRLNDALRTGESDDGMIVVTAGIRAMGPGFLAEATKAVAAFDAFDAGNDPRGEHDFGSLTVRGEKLFFKVDYFDLSMSAHSPDPSDPAVTRRVLTIMLASEY
jgi:hypothetical protein